MFYSLRPAVRCVDDLVRHNIVVSYDTVASFSLGLKTVCTT